MKRLFISFVTLLCAATITANAQPWNCGDPSVNGGANVTATLSGNTLTISGTEQFLIKKTI
jgi:hypothetical protein